MESKLLIGRKAICNYLRIGNRLFYELVAEGAPISKGVGGWRSHGELLEEYFKREIKASMTTNTAGVD